MTNHTNLLADTDEFMKQVGAELREIRRTTGLPLQEVGDVLGWGRDAISKIELGQRSISLHDYARIMHFYREVAPDHPGVALAARFTAKPARRRRSAPGKSDHD